MFKQPKIQKLLTPILLGIGLTMAGELPASSSPYYGRSNHGHINHGHSNHGHRNVHHQRSSNYHREVFRNRGDRRSLNVRPRRSLPVKHPHHGHGNVYYPESAHHRNHRGNNHDYYYDRYGNLRRRRLNHGNVRHHPHHGKKPYYGKKHSPYNHHSRPVIKIRLLR